MTNAIDQIKEISGEIKSLQSKRANVARDALKELSNFVFDKYPELKNFAFGISGREYNDEGLYEGVNHVAINLDDQEVENEYWDKYDWRTSRSEGVEGEIYDALKLIGDPALIAVCGEYDIVFIERDDPETFETVSPYL